VRATLLVVLVVGGGARVAWVAHEAASPRFASDPEAYLLQGEVIARGEGYANPLVDIENATRMRRHETPVAAQPASFYPPGYPVFVAAATWTVWHTPIPDGDLVRAIEYIQALLGTLTILFVFLLGWRVFDARVGSLAAAIVAVYPNLIATTATLQFETVFITLLLATMLVLLPAATRDDPGRMRLVVGGALIGVVALIHPTSGLLIFAFLAARVTLRRPWRETARDVAILIACVVLVIAPWTIRNAVRLHAFVPIATGAGPALCQSRNSESNGAINLGVLDRECAPKRRASSFAKQEVAVNRYATSHAIRWVVHHPFAELQMWWRRTDLAYRVDTSGLYAPNLTGNARRTVTTLSNVVSLMVLAFAALGVLVTLVRRRSSASVYLVAATATLAAVPIILFGDPRYRVPAEPLFAILAAAALGTTVELLTRAS
jgi:4-amino-4-deoxy-L-arabinose transferase-like glycosyltransferase